MYLPPSCSAEPLCTPPIPRHFAHDKRVIAGKELCRPFTEDPQPLATLQKTLRPAEAFSSDTSGNTRSSMATVNDEMTARSTGTAPFYCQALRR
jgi:hypothetical protein